jgi:hypothetical protein
VVVDQVEDLGDLAIGKREGRDVGLPHLVGQVGFKADARAQRALLRLR